MSNLTIHPRSDWHASPPTRPRTRRNPAGIHEFFIHWPAESGSLTHIETKSEECKWIKGVQHYHQTKTVDPFIDIGYNLIVANSGDFPRVYTARGCQYLPAAQLDHNPGTLALCVMLGESDIVRPALVSRIRSVIRWAEGYTGNRLAVRPHSAVTGTECPGPRLRALIQQGAFDIH